MRTQRDTFNPAYSNVIKNQSPQFNDLSLQDYRLRDNSPAINAGKPEIASQIPLDILGRDRTLRPDIGAYQYYEIEEEQE